MPRKPNKRTHDFVHNVDSQDPPVTGKDDRFGLMDILHINGQISRFVKTCGGMQEVVIQATRLGIRITMLGGANVESVIEPTCGNVYNLIFIPDPHRAKRKEKSHVNTNKEVVNKSTRTKRRVS